MSTIESRLPTEGKPGKSRYRARVRIKGTPAVSATFERLTDARHWAQDTEADIRAGRYFKNATAKDHTVAKLIDKYIVEILPQRVPPWLHPWLLHILRSAALLPSTGQQRLAMPRRRERGCRRPRAEEECQNCHHRM